eukprot:m51a1_g7724 hypothetical protein (139) ;mRNA; r:151991-152798
MSSADCEVKHKHGGSGSCLMAVTFFPGESSSKKVFTREFLLQQQQQHSAGAQAAAPAGLLAKLEMIAKQQAAGSPPRSPETGRFEVTAPVPRMGFWRPPSCCGSPTGSPFPVLRRLSPPPVSPNAQQQQQQQRTPEGK